MGGSPQLPLTADSATELGPIVQIMHGRLQWADLQMTADLAVWLEFLSKGNPGNAVLWAWTVRAIARSRYESIVTLHHWIYAFPMGVPTDEGMLEVWDAQKVDYGNGLDYERNWP